MIPIPEIVFIIPYRDREEQLHFFKRQIKYILEDYDQTAYKILYIHQCDQRSFNRGALKNIGFLVIKDLYPDHYKNITIVFNDVDTIANRKNILDFKTKPGVVKHFYGFPFALGGIVAIHAGDFEIINGFPNFWSWGYEDNLLQTRVLKHHFMIDRSQFYPLMDPHIIHLNESIKRVVNREEFNRFVYNTNEGLQNISNLQYTMDHETDFVNVYYFETGITENSNSNIVHDITKSNPLKRNMQMVL
jgi:hypothetical protein